MEAFLEQFDARFRENQAILERRAAGG